MNEYIEREATVKAFCEQCSDYVNGKCTFEGACDVSIITTVPAADVQPVKRGRWIKQEGFWNKNTVKCSLCGNYLDINGVNGGRSDANYCPNCGARMDE